MDKHPFALLNEMYQAGLLGILTYTDCGGVSAGWKATIETSNADAGISPLISWATAGSKQAAKRSAAQNLLSSLLHVDSSGRLNRFVQATTGSADIESTNQVQVDKISEQSAGIASDPLLSRRQRERLVEAGKHLQTLQDAYRTTSTSHCASLILAIDVEWYERGKVSEILEVGVAWVSGDLLRDPKAPIVSHHFVIDETYHLRNGRYVPDNKDRYNFGTSERLSLKNLRLRIDEIFRACAPASHSITLVGHSLNHDMTALDAAGIWPRSISSGIIECDIALAHQALHGRTQVTGLAKLLEELEIAALNLHNAANDAVYTIQAASKIAAYTLPMSAGAAKLNDRCAEEGSIADRASSGRRETARELADSRHSCV